MKTGDGKESKIKLSELEERGLVVWGKLTLTGTVKVLETGGLESQSNNDLNTIEENIQEDYI